VLISFKIGTTVEFVSDDGDTQNYLSSKYRSVLVTGDLEDIE
jgi:hypothetical protein